MELFRLHLPAVLLFRSARDSSQVETSFQLPTCFRLSSRPLNPGRQPLAILPQFGERDGAIVPFHTHSKGHDVTSSQGERTCRMFNPFGSGLATRPRNASACIHTTSYRARRFFFPVFVVLAWTSIASHLKLRTIAGCFQCLLSRFGNRNYGEFLFSIPQIGNFVIRLLHDGLSVQLEVLFQDNPPAAFLPGQSS